MSVIVFRFKDTQGGGGPSLLLQGIPNKNKNSKKIMKASSFTHLDILKMGAGYTSSSAPKGIKQGFREIPGIMLGFLP